MSTHAYCFLCGKTRIKPGRFAAGERRCGRCNSEHERILHQEFNTLFARLSFGECQFAPDDIEQRIARFADRAAKGLPLFATERGDG